VSLIFGPSATLQVKDTAQINTNAATKTFVSTFAGPGSHNSGSSGDVTITVPAQAHDYTAIVTVTGDFVEAGSPHGGTQPTIDAHRRDSPGPGGDVDGGNFYTVKSTTYTAGNTYERVTLQGQFSSVAGQAYYFGYKWTSPNAALNPINWQNIQIQVVLVFR